MIQSENPAVAGVEGLASDANSSTISTGIPNGAGNKDRIDGKGGVQERPAPEWADNSATISPCRLYRYRLTRRWSEAKPSLTFIMLNPSTADAFRDDPTIRRCVGFAKREGAGGVEIFNLYAFRATSPKDLPRDGREVGPENERFLEMAVGDAIKAGMPVVCAWGAHGDGEAFVRMATTQGATLRALGLTKYGQPKHPLHIAADAPLIFYPIVSRPEAKP